MSAYDGSMWRGLVPMLRRIVRQVRGPAPTDGVTRLPRAVLAPVPVPAHPQRRPVRAPAAGWFHASGWSRARR